MHFITAACNASRFAVCAAIETWRHFSFTAFFAREASGPHMNFVKFLNFFFGRV